MVNVTDEPNHLNNMSHRALIIPIRLNSHTTSSIHENVSRGYYQIDTSGQKVFVPYDKNEMGKIHSFISPQRMQYKHMKWNKTRKWKDREKAKKSKWKYHPTFGGMNTVST